jgi:hypothetical protein
MYFKLNQHDKRGGLVGRLLAYLKAALAQQVKFTYVFATPPKNSLNPIQYHTGEFHWYRRQKDPFAVKRL